MTPPLYLCVCVWARAWVGVSVVYAGQAHFCATCSTLTPTNAHHRTSDVQSPTCTHSLTRACTPTTTHTQHVHEVLNLARSGVIRHALSACVCVCVYTVCVGGCGCRPSQYVLVCCNTGILHTDTRARTHTHTHRMGLCHTGRVRTTPTGARSRCLFCWRTWILDDNTWMHSPP